MSSAAVAMSPADSVTTSGKMRSVEASRAVAKVEGITKTERLVLYALAEFAGEGSQGLECHPGIKTIAARTRISERQATRVVHSLRVKNIITFEDNKGGKRVSNRYALLFANPDKPNPDSSNHDIRNPDILNANTDKSNTLTLAKQHANPDTAMSGEWFKGFNEWKEQWKDKTLLSNCSFDGSLFQNKIQDHFSHPSRFLCYEDVEAQVYQFEEKPEELLRQILNGAPVQRIQTCDRKGHGSFVRPGYRFGNWIAWAGQEGCYGDNWYDAGCEHCRSEHEELLRGEPKRWVNTLPISRFELATPATCLHHGHFILWASITEYSEEYGKACGSKFRVGISRYNIPCPRCEGDSIYEQQLQEDLRLSNEEWERGGQRIIEAIAYAQEVTQ